MLLETNRFPSVKSRSRVISHRRGLADWTLFHRLSSLFSCSSILVMSEKGTAESSNPAPPPPATPSESEVQRREVQQQLEAAIAAARHAQNPKSTTATVSLNTLSHSSQGLCLARAGVLVA